MSVKNCERATIDKKVNRRAVLAGANDFYGIPDRQFMSDTSKAKDLAEEQLARFKDVHIRISLRLQQAFGLRREEALIPGGRQYIEQLRIYERHTANAGLSRMHGLRHAYAQRRYRELTGRPSPHAGGPAKEQLNVV